MTGSRHVPPAKNFSHTVLFGRLVRRSAILLAAPVLALAVHAQSSTSTGGASVTTTTSTGDTKTVLAAPSTVDASKSPHLKATNGPAPEDVNRKALEENAGKDAGKILVRTTPSHARIYINGAFVGYTPQLFVVPPGKYKVELRGARDNHAERTVGLLPNGTEEVSMDLAARYPSKVVSPSN
jgi:PEGA domain-containing protein